MKKEFKVQGLCFRCESRALFLEGKGQPRCECGDSTRQVCSCYMFRPCKPVVTIEHKYSKIRRPRFSSPMLSSREQGVELYDGQLYVLKINNKKVCILWKLKMGIGRKK